MRKRGGEYWVQGEALLSVGEAHKQTYPRLREERRRGQGAE